MRIRTRERESDKWGARKKITLKFERERERERERAGRMEGRNILQWSLTYNNWIWLVASTGMRTQYLRIRVDD